VTASQRSGRLNLRCAKVLVADDNRASMELLSQVLLGFGVSRPTLCETAAAAQGALAADKFDLILMDGELAGVSGFDLCQRLRHDSGAINQTTPVILVSAFATAERTLKARDCGASFVVAKPIVPGVLLERIEWIAQHTRAFVVSGQYCGPDRRFRNIPLPEGTPERRADRQQLISEPARAMSQTEIDSLFA
jgi:CheY-like chemotaxis protein